MRFSLLNLLALLSFAYARPTGLNLDSISNITVTEAGYGNDTLTILLPEVLPRCGAMTFDPSGENHMSACPMPKSQIISSQPIEWIETLLQYELFLNTTTTTEPEPEGAVFKQKRPKHPKAATEEDVIATSLDGKRKRLALRQEDKSRRLTCSNKGPKGQTPEPALDVCGQVSHRFEFQRTMSLLPRIRRSMAAHAWSGAPKDTATESATAIAATTSSGSNSSRSAF
jgi:hypothetical protein